MPPLKNPDAPGRSPSSRCSRPHVRLSAVAMLMHGSLQSRSLIMDRGEGSCACVEGCGVAQ
jgi:hypothetical protein